MKEMCSESKSVFLLPSLLFSDPEPHCVQTVLGSCVAVCLYDEQRKQGGINHYMMPWWNGSGLASPKYGDIAVENLIQQMIAIGSHKKNLIAKLFGGASQHDHSSSIFQIGERNISTAEKILHEHRISVVARSVGGSLGRKIVYHTGSGKVFLKYLNGIHSEQSS